MKNKERNGNIELLRFVFCVMMVLYHAWYVRRGYIGVEFFFMVTGYFLAEKICRLNAREAPPIGRKCHEGSNARCYEALSLNISVLFCRHHFGIYSACLCTEMGQCSNPVGRAVDSSGFLILAKPWIFDNICHGGIMVSFRYDFCGLDAISVTAQTL